MKKIAGLIVSIFLVFVFTSSVALSQVPGSASVAKRKEEATKKRMIYLTRDEILAGAKKEGKVVTAPGYQEITRGPMVQAFQKKHPFITNVEWRIVQDDGGEHRQILEMQAGRSTLDVFSPHLTHYSEYLKFNPFLRYDLTAMAQDGQLQIPPQMIDETGVITWLGTVMGGNLYHTKLVSPDRAPSTWESCLDPQWKGKIAFDTKPRALAFLVPVWGEEKVLDFAKKLKANEPIWSTGATAGITQLSTGEFSIYCGVMLHSAYRGLKKDPSLPLKVVVPNLLPIGLLEPEAISANAKNPHAGLLWIEFLASKEGQKIADEINPGRASVLVEGTLAYEASKERKVSLCGPRCSAGADRFMSRIAVEAWGFPKAK
jgi:ABC-type Fe3+ transport system substrate-binding protein